MCKDPVVITVDTNIFNALLNTSKTGKLELEHSEKNKDKLMIKQEENVKKLSFENATDLTLIRRN